MALYRCQNVCMYECARKLQSRGGKCMSRRQIQFFFGQNMKATGDLGFSGGGNQKYEGRNLNFGGGKIKNREGNVAK